MGVEVVSSSEYRPSFDEVFAALVSQSDESRAEHGDEGESDERNRRGALEQRRGYGPYYGRVGTSLMLTTHGDFTATAYSPEMSYVVHGSCVISPSP